MRLPNIACYLLGVLLLSLAARVHAGSAGFRAALIVLLANPFVFHFGRLVGWYSVAFAFLAAATWLFARYNRDGSVPALLGFLTAALCLVHTNYYGWCAILGLLAFEPSLRGRGRWKPVAAGFAGLVFAYIPLWRILGRLTNGYLVGGRVNVLARFVDAIYCLYSLLTSESFAPWFLYASIPIAVCLAILSLACYRATPESRRYLIRFSFLFAGMAALGIASTRRLLFASAWLFLSIALALASSKGARRWALFGCLAVPYLFGWTGIAERSHYASTHFAEPWSEIAFSAARRLESGGVVATNSVSLEFELNYALAGLGKTVRPGFPERPNLVSLERDQDLLSRLRGEVLFVRGTNDAAVEETRTVETWLGSHCRERSHRDSVPDTGALLKARLFGPRIDYPQYRVSEQVFDCPQ